MVQLDNITIIGNKIDLLLPTKEITINPEFVGNGLLLRWKITTYVDENIIKEEYKKTLEECINSIKEIENVC